MEQNKDVKKPEVITEKIPEKLLNPILDAQNKVGQLRNRFFGLSLRLAQFQKDVQKTLEEIENTEKSIRNKMEHSFKKMKLGKKKNINWKYNPTNGSFEGTVKPEPKKPEAPEIKKIKEGK